MMDRTKPYNADEERVCTYLRLITDDQVGCGDDPIGFLMASHAALRMKVQRYRDALGTSDEP